MASATYDVKQVDQAVSSAFGEHVLTSVTAFREDGVELFQARLSNTFPYGHRIFISNEVKSIDTVIEAYSRVADQALLHGRITLKTHAELRARYGLHNTFDAIKD